MITLQKIPEIYKDRKIIGIFFLFFLIFIAVAAINNKKEREEFIANYNNLSSCEISGTVKEIKRSRGGTTLVVDELNNSMLCFISFSINDAEGYDITNYIKVNDSIFKRQNSTELTIIKENVQQIIKLE